MSSTLDSQAAFTDRAETKGVQKWIIEKDKDRRFVTFGKLAFAFTYSPQSATNEPLKKSLTDLLEEGLAEAQLAALRRLFFESHTTVLTDVRMCAESNPDPSATTRKLPVADRVVRQRGQERRLGGIVFNPCTIPPNHLVDTFVEVVETGVLTYVKAEHCCNRSQEVKAFKTEPTVPTDALGMPKIGTKQTDASCEAISELKLRAAWQRKNLLMDPAGLATFELTESWTQYPFTLLLKEQPRGFAKISFQQLVGCDKHMWILAWGAALGKFEDFTEVLQYLTPVPAMRNNEAPQPCTPRPHKHQKGEKGQKGHRKGPGAATAASFKVQVPEGRVTHDSKNSPLCVACQTGKFKFRGPAGRRCARGYHKCYKRGCQRPKPFYLCNHAD